MDSCLIRATPGEPNQDQWTLAKIKSFLLDPQTHQITTKERKLTQVQYEYLDLFLVWRGGAGAEDGVVGLPAVGDLLGLVRLLAHALHIVRQRLLVELLTPDP